MPPPATPTRAITILDVAREAEVSKSTVSLVLQGSDRIRKDTAQRVRDAAIRLGYVYNRHAGELRRRSSNVIGVIINDLRNPFFAELLTGIERKLVEAGHVVLMAHTNESLERQRQVLTTMREQNVAGIALCPARATPVSLPKTVKSWNIPLVVMIRTLGRGTYDFAGSDNESGVRLAVDHLFREGHERIAFLGGHAGPVLEQRLQGYKAALLGAGLEFDPDLVFAAGTTRQGGYGAMLKLLQRRPDIKAAVSYNDLVAFGALSALGERGLKAGADFALMGFDNVLDAEHSNPPLSTIDVGPESLGERVAEMLLARLQTPDLPRQRYLATPQLVRRQSA